MRERQPDLSQGPCRNLISAVNRLCCCSTFCLRVFFVVVVVVVAWPICRWVYERHDPVATLCVSFIGHLSIHYLIYCPLLHRICKREAGLEKWLGGAEGVVFMLQFSAWSWEQISQQALGAIIAILSRRERASEQPKQAEIQRCTRRDSSKKKRKMGDDRQQAWSWVLQWPVAYNRRP